MVEKMCPSEIVGGNKFIKNWPLIFWNGAVYGHCCKEMALPVED